MTLDRPSRDNILLSSAALWALRSTCSRAQVGVVIATKDYRPLVSGYNGAPAGMDHCEHVCTCGRDRRRQMTVVMGDTFIDAGHADNCLGQRPCEISVHGEANAIAYAAREGVSVKRGQLFTTVAPCTNCSMLIVNSGICRVIYHHPHRDMAGVELLDKAGVEVVAYEHD